MKRRDLLAALCSAAGASIVRPVQVGAQQTKKAPRIGYLITGSKEPLDDAFRQGLHDLGYTEGENIVIEDRSAGGNTDRFPGLAAELVRLKIDVIVAANTRAGLAAQQATTTIPIVVSVMGDPVGDGLVASLARPGGNVTGLTFLGPELVPKRIELLKDALPGVSRVAVLWHPGGYGERTTTDMLKQAEAAATAVGVQVRFVDVRGADDFERAFSAIAAEHADALMVFPSPMFFNERRQIVELAAKYRLPSISMARELVQIGGLISYGASIYDLIRRSATFVDKILKGAKPGDLPVEQPTNFELAINLKTARAFGLTIPQSLIYRADEVIE